MRSPTSLMESERSEDAYFKSKILECSCSSPCHFKGAAVSSRSFSDMNETERTGVVRGILLAVTSPLGKPNELMKCSSGSKKRSHNDMSEFTKTSSARS